MNALGMQVAFVLPLLLPLVYAATMYRRDWFYPALMIAVGAHYLPFIFSYGMKHFGALAATLIALGLFLGMRVPHKPLIGVWSTTLLLLLFAFVGRQALLTEEKSTRECHAAI